MSSKQSLIYRKGVYQDEKGRDFFFDNAKFILIFLVVLAHALSPLKTGNGFLTYMWRVINTLHMPCLIFISGYFGKRYISGKGLKVQRPFTYAVLYIAAQLSVRLFERYVLGDSVAFSLFSAASSLWFLQCLFWWYLLLPLLDRFKPKYVMIFAVLLGLFCCYDARINNFLAFSRMMVHMPFFLAGYYLTYEDIQKLFTAKARLLSIPAWILPLAGFAAISYHPTEWLSVMNKAASRIITCSYNYWDIPALQDSAISPLLWWTTRVWFYASAALLCFGFLVWVPRSWNLFTRFGARTLQVYILHRFLYLAELKYEWWKPFNTTGGIIAMALIALATTIILSLKIPFSWPFDLLQGIKVTKLLKEEDKPKTPAAEAAAPAPEITADDGIKTEAAADNAPSVSEAENTPEIAPEAAAEDVPEDIPADAETAAEVQSEDTPAQ